MSKKYMELIKKIANRYDVKLKNVEDSEKAGIFIDLNGEKKNVEEIDNLELFNNIFNTNSSLFKYNFLEVNEENSFIQKQIKLAEKDNEEYTFNYTVSNSKGRVA